MNHNTSAGKVIHFITCCLFGLLLTGCSSDGPVPVTGKITLNGKPVADAGVTFTPASRDQGEVAVGVTDESGAYSLNLLKGKVTDGAMPGEYRVSISKLEVTKGKQANSNLDESFSSLQMASSPPPKVKHLIPPKYSSTSTSGLSFEVKRGEDNKADFELVE